MGFMTVFFIGFFVGIAFTLITLIMALLMDNKGKKT